MSKKDFECSLGFTEPGISCCKCDDDCPYHKPLDRFKEYCDAKSANAIIPRNAMSTNSGVRPGMIIYTTKGA